MKKSKFNNRQVKVISYFLQGYMLVNEIESMNADECADLLEEYELLEKTAPKPAFNFRQMLRDGRDGMIALVTGAEQEKPKTPWKIKKC